MARLKPQQIKRLGVTAAFLNRAEAWLAKAQGLREKQRSADRDLNGPRFATIYAYFDKHKVFEWTPGRKMRDLVTGQVWGSRQRRHFCEVEYRSITSAVMYVEERLRDEMLPTPQAAPPVAPVVVAAEV